MPDFQIDTAAKRAKLPARKNPYWTKIAGGRGGVSLGYRRIEGAPGSWVAKIVVAGKRVEERIGAADDENAAVGDALPYRQAVAAALEWSRWKQSAVAEAKKSAQPNNLTVTQAVEDYAEARVARAPKAGAITRGRLRSYVLDDTAFAGLALAKLRATDIEAWRRRLPKRLAPTTENRILNDLRAALNAACERHRRNLPPFLRDEIRVGTRARPAASNARKQVLPYDDVRRIVDAAFAVDPDGDFGRLVMLAAATGARFCQLAAMRVEHVQAEFGRVLVPTASKGRAARPKPPIAVPLAPDILERLSPAFENRATKDALLERWAYRRTGPFQWTKERRRPWRAAYEIEKLWSAALAHAGAPKRTVMYALRHSSIVRGLRAGLPIRLVAAAHDTSVEMIEAHYSAFIIDATEDLARRAAISFAEAAE
ncbi:MAG: integrase [Hyphomicrobiales bacterium]|nr:MAG: integrase [Hyphomicrobiales bacterium]